MTLDNTSDSTPAESTESSAAPDTPTKPVRRRATRAAKAAAEPAPTADAPTAETPAAADEAPAKPVRRRATRTTKAKAAQDPAPDAPVTLEQAAAAQAPAAAEPAATTTAEAGKAPAAPRRRRATRTTAAPADEAASSAAPTAPEPVAAEPTAASEQVAAEPAPDAAAPVAAEPAARPRRSRRVTRPAAPGVPVDAAPAAPPAPATPPAPAVPVEDEAAEDEAVEDEAVEADQVPAATTAEAPAAAPRLDVLAELAAQQAEPPRARARRGRGGRAAASDTSAPSADAAPEAPAAAQRPEQAPAADRGAAQTSPAAPAPADAGRPAAARLATTALLFQAPEAPRRRRRASAPSGSPEAISAAAKAEEEAAQAQADAAAAADATEEQASTPEPRSSRRGRGRRSRGQDRPADEQPADEQPADEAPVEDAPIEASDVPAEDATADRAEDEAPEVDGADESDAEGDQADDEGASPRRRRRRGGRGRRSRTGGDADGAQDDDERRAQDDASDDAGQDAEADADDEDQSESGADGEEQSGSRRRRRRRRSGRGDGEAEPARRSGGRSSGDEVTALRGSTRLEAKRQRRREGRDAGRRRQIITEAEFLARRESVERSMVVREAGGKTQIAVLEDGVLVEHYVSRQAQVSMAGNVYLGRVQNVLPSMEAAFVDVGKGRNAVLYAGEVNWDAAGVDGGQPRRIEQALKSGDSVLVQVTKDPIGHKGARLTSQVTLAGRYLVYVPGGGMTGISRKLPEPERARLKKILREVVPDSAGVIVRTAAEGASEEELRADIARLQSQWEAIEKKAKTASAPALLQGEPDLAIRVVRDIFNDDFSSLVVQGEEAWATISGYIGELAPDLAEKVTKWTGTGDVFAAHRVDEQLAKGMDRKVWLPSGGSLVIDRTEAMTVVDVNTGKFTGAGGTLEETVTRNNLEAAEEIVRQLRLRDIGGIIVIDFIDMVLESNRDLVLRRLVECLGRDRTKHQVAEVTSLGLVQMTRKRVGQGLVEAFSETCEHCNGRGFVVHTEPVEKGNHRPDAGAPQQPVAEGESKRSRRKRGAKEPAAAVPAAAVPVLPEAREAVKATLATIAAAAAHAHGHDEEPGAEEAPTAAPAPAPEETPVAPVATVPDATPEAPEEAAPQQAPAEDAPAAAPRRGRGGRRATRPAAEPVLDVLKELGGLVPSRADGQGDAGQDVVVESTVTDVTVEVTASVAGDGDRLELTPVDPSLFDLPGAGSDEDDDPVV